MLKVFLRALRSTSFFFTSSLGGLFRVRLTAAASAQAEASREAEGPHYILR